VNGYGPTETTSFAVTYEIRGVKESALSIPIGRPIAKTRVYILNENQEPVAVGVVGEIYIGGAGVARGYLNQPDFTAERFLPDPYGGPVGSRMYRTGDRGRWNRDQNLEFAGRVDRQVKIRGYRVELGEIEARLVELHGVKEAVVMVRVDMAGDKRLVAYYTCDAGNEESKKDGEGTKQEIETDDLREYASERLPKYMVPAAYVRLEKFPLTPNGKLDRKALPATEGDTYGMREYEPPEGETETLLAGIWTQILNVARVGRNDNFFELGGHSLLAMQMIARLRALGMEVPVKEVFAWPVLSGFAEWLIDQQLARFDSDDLATARKQMEEADSQSEVL
jgi:hypothetical protein